MLRNVGRTLLAVLWLVVFSAPAFSQSSIAGVVTDATGGVLPGVTIEANSPALIEQARSVVSDANGAYRLVDLRPGTYKVTFTLPGFTTFVREGIALESDFTATVNAQMKVGGVEETITVSGASPVVDVQSTTSRTVVSAEQVDALPTGRSYQTLAATVPALAASGSGRFDVGGATQMWQGTVAAYGSLGTDMALEVDGISVQSLLNTGSIAGAGHNQEAYQEMSYQVVAGSADSQSGGVRINMIPKEGGNRFSGGGVATYSNRHLAAENNDAELRARGLNVAPSLYEIFDYNASLGGPLKRGRLWFFVSPRVWGVSNFIANQRFPDGSPAYDHTKLQAYTTRLTLQLNPKNKVTGLYDDLPRYRQYFGSETGTRTPEGSSIQDQFTSVVQAKWTSTVTSKLLLEAGYSRHFVGYNLAYEDGVARPTAANPFGDISKADTGIQSKTIYNAAPTEFYQPLAAKNLVMSVSYVTGTHSFKVGVQDKFGWTNNTVTQNGNMVQVYNTGRPLQVRAYNTPLDTRVLLNYDLGLYVQDSWKIRRLTVTPGLRYEGFNASVDPQSAPAGRFVGARKFDAIPNLPNFKNWVPRLGAAYDVFGNGKTGIKGSYGRYMQQDATSFPNTYNPMVQTTANLAWTDLNSDDIAQGELGCAYLSPGCEINFAQLSSTFGTRRNRNPDPDLQRQFQRVYNIGVTREIRSGVGVAANYFRREFHALTYTSSLSVPFSAYTPFSIPDPRNNGQTMTVYNVNPAALAAPINELDTTSATDKRTFNGIDMIVNARFRNGAFLTGGTSTGRQVATICSVVDPNNTRFCDESQFDIPFQTTFKLSGSHPMPYGFRLSGVFQRTPGDAVSQTFVVTAANFRALTGVTMGQSSVTLRLNEPGSRYLDTVNQLDLTIAKSFKVGQARISPELSLFNVFNANPVLSETTSYPAVGTPLRILDGRLIRFNAQVRF